MVFSFQLMSDAGQMEYTRLSAELMRLQQEVETAGSSQQGVQMQLSHLTESNLSLSAQVAVQYAIRMSEQHAVKQKETCKALKADRIHMLQQEIGRLQASQTADATQLRTEVRDFVRDTLNWLADLALTQEKYTQKLDETQNEMLRVAASVPCAADASAAPTDAASAEDPAAAPLQAILQAVAVEDELLELFRNDK